MPKDETLNIQESSKEYEELNAALDAAPQINYIVGAALSNLSVSTNPSTAPIINLIPNEILAMSIGWNYLDGLIAIATGIEQITDEENYRQTQQKIKGVLNIVSGIQLLVASYNPALAAAIGLSTGAALAAPAFALATLIDLINVTIDWCNAYKENTFEGWLDERVDEVNYQDERIKKLKEKIDMLNSQKSNWDRDPHEIDLEIKELSKSIEAIENKKTVLINDINSRCRVHSEDADKKNDQAKKAFINEKIKNLDKTFNNGWLKESIENLNAIDKKIDSIKINISQFIQHQKNAKIAEYQYNNKLLELRDKIAECVKFKKNEDEESVSKKIILLNQQINELKQQYKDEKEYLEEHNLLLKDFYIALRNAEVKREGLINQISIRTSNIFTQSKEEATLVTQELDPIKFENPESLKEINQRLNKTFEPTADDKKREKQIQKQLTQNYEDVTINLCVKGASFVGMTLLAVSAFVVCPPVLIAGLIITSLVAVYYLRQNGEKILNALFDDVDEPVKQHASTVTKYSNTFFKSSQPSVAPALPIGTTQLDADNEFIPRF